MRTVKQILDDEKYGLSDKDKLEVLLEFVSAYQPWAILFEEFLTGWLQADEPADTTELGSVG